MRKISLTNFLIEDDMSVTLGSAETRFMFLYKKLNDVLLMYSEYSYDKLSEGPAYT